ncbi:MAG: SGNH/GDSL hydrolase family protein [Alphaproteobacteria bacterium]|nr:SGNH/GDSL hydrolase family protein [Alphaproteobacteria bacterium]
MKKNFFEKYARLVLITINLVFLGLVVWVINLDILQDAPGAEKYSLYNKMEYELLCRGKRFIKLRENRPNQNTFRVPPYDETQKYSFRTDENGFVLPSKIYENPDLNIFFIGGSTTECEMVDEPYRFPYLSGRILEEKTGKKINSYNGGKSGNNSIHSINSFINKIMPLNPDVVVQMETINDLSTLLYEATYWNRNVSRSNLACFSQKETGLRNFKNEWAASPFRGKIFDVAHQQKIKAEYRKILTLFVSVTRAVGAKPVLMTQANKIVDNPDFLVSEGDKEFSKKYRELYTDFQNITRDVAKKNGVLLIDLAKEVPPLDEYLYDSVHLTNEGSKLVAKIISKKLEKYVSH